MPNNFMAIDQGLPRFTGEESLEQRVKMLQDYQYQLVEQLRYALQHLDTRNMNMDAMGEWGGTLTEPLYASLMDEDGNMLSLAVVAEGIVAQIANAEGDLAALEVTAATLAARISNAEGSITSLQATAEGLSTRVSNAEGAASDAQQTANGFAVRVSNLENNESVYLYVNSKGLIVSDEDGAVAIDGGQLIADTVILNKLYGDKIYLLDGNDKEAARFSIAGASSYDGGKVVIESGAVEIGANANGGAVYISAHNGAELEWNEDLSAGCNILPSADETYDLGSTSYYWDDIYAANCLASTSDRNRKNSISYDLSAYDKVFDGLMPASYKLNSGTSGRRHIGLVAQDVEIGLEKSGLTGLDFAGLIKSPKKDKDGNVIESEYVYGLRYGEFIGLLIDQVQKLKSRVAELERSKA